MQTIWPAIHGLAFLAVFALFAVSLPSTAWPWYFVLPLAVYGSMVLLLPPLRRSAPDIALGRVDRVGILTTFVFSAAATAVLLLYQAFAYPDPARLLQGIPMTVFGSGIIAWAWFSFGNALMEELIFRGILYHAVAAKWGVAGSIGTTSVLFGLAHLHGYPAGPLGVALAVLFGLGMGWLRWWSGGLALPVACHVCADATIFGILVMNERGQTV